jgi:hypothetical protein
VLVHEDPLLALQWPFLEQDVVADADLADVVQEPGPLDLLDLVLGELHLAAHGLSDAAHPVRVTAGVPIPGVHRVGQGADGLLEQLPRLDVPVIRQSGREERDHEKRSRPPANAVRKSEYLCHKPRKWSEPHQVRGDAPQILSPHRPYRRPGATTDCENGQDSVQEIEDAATCQQAKKRDQVGPASEGRGSGTYSLVDDSANDY